MTAAPLGWFSIVRLGFVQAALGAIVVLATSTMNRVMTVELALPAIVPGILVALHYALQVLRPRLGYGSDVGGRRTPWVIGGMVLLTSGGVLAAIATALMGRDLPLGLALAVVAFAMIGVGVGASGTSLLVLLAKRVAPGRRAAAASIVWLMMIAGIAVTATVASRQLDPFSPQRLVEVTACVAGLAMIATLLAVWRVEGPAAARNDASASAPAPPFFRALAQVWAERQARRFAVFVFISMLAYSAQELVLEPFAGAVFGLTPGQSTGLSGVLHGGVLLGMALVAVAGSAFAGSRFGTLRVWTIGGCIASSLAVLGLAATGLAGATPLLRGAVFVLGVANGTFAVAAIGSMMQLAGSGAQSREGVRMGLWGAAQAVAFGLGGLLGTGGSDLGRLLLGSPVAAYAAVFAGEALLFLWAAWLAGGVYVARAAGDGVTAPRPAVNPAPSLPARA